MKRSTWLARRNLLMAAGASLALGALPPASAAALTPTPWQATGPFYPDHLPADTDSDLLRNASPSDTAQGEPLGLAGRLIDTAGRPLDGARIEIWQCDAGGRYLHSGDRQATPRRDPGFQGFGASATGTEGEFGFRTIRPVPYPGRTPHIHLRVLDKAGAQRLVTQLYVEGEPLNARDGLFRRLSPEEAARISMVLRPAERDGLAWQSAVELIVS